MVARLKLNCERPCFCLKFLKQIQIFSRYAQIGKQYLEKNKKKPCVFKKTFYNRIRYY